MFLYINGSQRYNKASNPSGTRAKWVIKLVRSWFSKKRIALGTTQEIYDIEIFTITCGLKIALEFSMAQYALEICIYFNNLSVIKNTGKILNKFSQATFIKFCKLAKLWLVKKGKTLTV